jgi:SAM-dependent methyltransferase|tara:strand:- start:20784 stop:21431 length:648 start_codon:yes stop_codon:yes gene_type:complete
MDIRIMAVSVDPKIVSQVTLGHYESNASSFQEGTQDHDVSQNINALLRHIRASAPCRILDFGCGPGRDLVTFKRLGYEPVGLDGTRAFVEMARANSGCEVWQQDFLALSLPDAYFDGVFANASLFHVPRAHLGQVLRQLKDALKPGGVLFCSNPRGDNQEGWSGERYAVYHDYEAWHTLLTEAGFTELEHYYRPTGLPRDQQPWLATVWRKPADV